jgi:hypothetical protein
MKLLFCDPSVEQFQNLRCFFLCFEAAFGLKINLSKSDIVAVGEVEDVEGLTGCGVASLPIPYLGLPLGAHYKASSIWSSNIEKMEHKLPGWKRLY